MPSRQEIEDYLNSLDEWVSHSIHAATADIPSLNAIANRVWADLSRFGAPSIQIPGLGIFDVPPPPPPPIPEPTLLERTGGWIVENKFKAVVTGLGIVLGSGLLVGYASSMLHQKKIRHKKRVTNNERKDVAVVLGVDCAIGIPLVVELESRGFIVIATVSNVESVKRVEDAGHGYLRALVFNPADSSAESTPTFLRLLQTTLSIRFPTTFTGDPYYSSPALLPQIHTLISLFSIHPPPPPIPLEHLQLSTDYLSYLQKTHISTLRVIQGILPLLRNGTNGANGKHLGGKKMVIICLPVIASRVGIAWNAASAMSAGATIKAIDVLRRELRETGQANRIAVTVVDVGAVGKPSAASHMNSYDTGAATYMNDWSSNLRATYGPAFLGALEHSRMHPRVPDDMDVVVSKLANLAHSSSPEFFGINWLDKQRIALGAGATTYALASRLPSKILDLILSIPSSLIRLRNSVVNETEKVTPEEEDPPNISEEEKDLDLDKSITLAPAYNKPPPSSVDSSDVDPDSTDVSESERVGSSWVSLESRNNAE